MKKTAVKILSALLMLSMVFSTNVFAANDETTSAWDSFLGLFSGVATSSEPVVQYRAHIQDLGDMPKPAGTYVTGPTEMGTRGQFLRMEGFWLKSSGLPTGTHLTYQVHVQNVGWMDWVGDDQFAGTQGDSQRIEAIKIKLVDATGNLATGYSVQYKGHVQDLGDLPANDPDYTGTTGWYADGQQLGTTGSSLRLEALQVQIISIKADMTAYNAAVATAAALTEADYTAASWTALETALTDNVVTDANTQAEVDAATAAINAAIDALVKVPTAIEATATGASELTVTFNGAVTDTTKAAINVKKGLTSVAVSEVAWNDDKTIATVTLGSKLKEATYTVSAAGVASTTLTDTIDCVDEALADINILSEKLVLQSGLNVTAQEVTATTTYEALNQYGEDITEGTLADNITVVASNGATGTTNDGVLTITLPSGYEVGDTYVTTLYDSASGVTANATLTLVDAAAAAKITIGDLYNEDDEALNLDNTGETFYLLLDLVDQYGNKITDVDVANDDLLVRSTDTTVMEIATTPIVEVTIDDVDYLAIELAWPTDPEADDTTIIVISKGLGTSAKKTIVVGEAFSADTITIGTPDGTIAGSTEIDIPVEAIGTDGEAITTLAGMDGTTITASQGGATITGAAFTEEDGQIYITLTTEPVASGSENLVVTVTTPTGNSESKTFKVYEDAVPSELVSLSSDISRNILLGQATTIGNDDFVVEDQYGNVMDEGTYFIKGTSDDTDYFTVSPTGVAAATNGDVTVTTVGTTAASKNVVFNLYEDATTSANSSITVKFTSVKTTSFASYEVSSIGTIYAPVSDADGLYEVQLEVYGVNSNGSKVLLPANTGLYTVSTLNTAYLSIDSSTAETMIAGLPDELDPDGLNDKPVSKAVTATVTINATGEKLTSTGTVTAAAPKVVSVGAYTTASVPATQVALQTATLTSLSSATFNSAASFNREALYGLTTFVTTDTYGVKTKVVLGDNDQLTMTKVSGTTVTFANNGTKDAAVTENTASAVVNAYITVDGINSNTVKVTLNTAYNASIASAKATLLTAITNATTLNTNTVASTDGTDVDNGSYWATAAQKTTYASAITAAQAVYDNASATATQVTTATTTLATATTTFNTQRAQVTVSYTALNTAISNANTNNATAVGSVDGSDVANGGSYVPTAAKTAYETAIADADAVANNATATQDEVDAAVTALASATTTFNTAKQTATTVYTTLEATVISAQALATDTTTSVDGTDVAATDYWVTASQMTAFTGAITTADAVANDATATQDEVDAANNALQAAYITFNGQRALGTL